jgi:hypothetical protein
MTRFSNPLCWSRPLLAILIASFISVVANCSRSSESDHLGHADALFAQGEYEAAKKEYLAILTKEQVLDDQTANAPQLKAAWIGQVKCSAKLGGPDSALVAVHSMFNFYSLGSARTLTLEDLHELRDWMAANGFTTAADRVAEEIKSRGA